MTPKNVFWSGLEFNLGNGRDVSFWGDNWIGEGRLAEIFLSLFKIAKEQDALVRDTLVKRKYKLKLRGTRDRSIREQKTAMRLLLQKKRIPRDGSDIPI